MKKHSKNSLIDALITVLPLLRVTKCRLHKVVNEVDKATDDPVAQGMLAMLVPGLKTVESALVLLTPHFEKLRTDQYDVAKLMDNVAEYLKSRNSETTQGAQVGESPSYLALILPELLDREQVKSIALDMAIIHHNLGQFGLLLRRDKETLSEYAPKLELRKIKYEVDECVSALAKFADCET